MNFVASWAWNLRFDLGAVMSNGILYFLLDCNTTPDINIIIRYGGNNIVSFAIRLKDLHVYKQF